MQICRITDKSITYDEIIKMKRNQHTLYSLIWGKKKIGLIVEDHVDSDCLGF